jgi:hypothetical protein
LLQIVVEVSDGWSGEVDVLLTPAEGIVAPQLTYNEVNEDNVDRVRRRSGDSERRLISRNEEKAGSAFFLKIHTHTPTHTLSSPSLAESSFADLQPTLNTTAIAALLHGDEHIQRKGRGDEKVRGNGRFHFAPRVVVYTTVVLPILGDEVFVHRF